MQLQVKKDGNIKVFCRFRPFNKKQIQKNSQKLHRIANKQTQLIIKNPTNQSQSNDKTDQMSFMYDCIFDMDSTQEQVFEQVGMPVLKNILQGFNGTIMAYGQTSSGKTHTMQGYDLNDRQVKGIMPRIMERLFVAIQKSTQTIQYKLKISIFQLYMEKIRDLLDVTKSDLKIRQNKAGPYVQNLTEVYVGQKAQLFKLIHYGQKNRITCATNMNELSSRSHMIFLLSLNQFNSADSSSKTSKLFLIDLAGSQKISKTGAQGKVLQQAKKINLSLTNLGKVIKSLGQKQGHVPYRDSKLTRILKDSLGGNSKTTLIVTCSPHQIHISQTISTLRFGENAQKIKNKPKINRELTVQQLQKIIDKIQQQAKIKDLKISILEKYIKEKLNAQLPNYSQFQNFNQIQLKIQKDYHDITQVKDMQNSDISEQFQDEDKSAIQRQNYQIKQSNMFSAIQFEQKNYLLSQISTLQRELSTNQQNLQNQLSQHRQLKREYNQLHNNLSQILKQNIDYQSQKSKIQQQNIDLRQKLQKLTNNSLQIKQISKQRQSQIQSQLIENNAPLIKMIIGQIFSIVGPYQQAQITKTIQNDHWYKKIMINGSNFVDFYSYQKDKLNQQIQLFIHQKQHLLKQSQTLKYSLNLKQSLKSQNLLKQYCKSQKVSKQQTLQSYVKSQKAQQTKNESIKNDEFLLKQEYERQKLLVLQNQRSQKQAYNKKIITLQTKLDKLFEQYQKMISIQTSWKVQCQLYQRKLKKKQQKIQLLQELLNQLQEQIQYLDAQNKFQFDDSRSVKSKIVKPIKSGGSFFR